MKVTHTMPIVCGDVRLDLTFADGLLHSLGSITVGGAALRNPAAPFLPWFDSYEGEVFDRFEFVEVRQRGCEQVLALRAVSNPGYPFRERRDSSGDLCFRNVSYNAEPVVSELNIVFKPAAATLAGSAFTGFTYWFEYANDACPIHRLLDRATWELGGNLDDVNLVCRNWLTPPRMKIGKDTTYSTVGLDQWAAALPGNMWGRWSLLPGFDLQYGQSGILVGWFDRVSLIRTAIESNAGEDAIRFNDSHWFEQAGRVSTNPKTILYCPERLDHTDALNLWTELQDRDCANGRRQFGIPEEEPPRLTLHHFVWRDYHFDHSYEPSLAIAAELGLDQILIDSCFEQGEALRMAHEKLAPPKEQEGTTLAKAMPTNMCCTLDYQVAAEHGGEAALRRLCERAAGMGLKVSCWMAAHLHPHSALARGPQAAGFAHGKNGAIAASESGRHPSTGYPGDCWTLNLNSPVYRYLADRILGICQRTGLSGFAWDSYSNLGWWQVDYSDGSMRPQFDKMGELYGELARAGLYIEPEAIVAFSSHSCCGLHGGDVYAGELLGYSYDSTIALEHEGRELLRGEEPPEVLFRCLAHRRAPEVRLTEVPRAEWSAAAMAAMKLYFAMYKQARGAMHRRTVLKDGLGVLWHGAGGERVFWSFREQIWNDGRPVDVLSGEAPAARRLQSRRVYRIEDEGE
jgi:hypothetical protein